MKWLSYGASAPIANSTKPKVVTLRQSATKMTLGGSGPVIEIWPTPSGKYG
ncbi:acinetodin/klebsidin/J25 family lasso peptide (plasmid) [Cupriavidus necator]|uniref:Acinetodin/klebsidin/J25 family lasso peptide n=2 Tax=Cupriavidus necator TaxID=106590 RepID=A0A367PBP7_CUPNE|nr:acinetodin/klebsidin/J25 family lasso peptide [Cupriavidus necator]RCJ05290.1 acinetodin/klebsidin/J25 family lasso peptide [Cupriavidus necator]